MTAISPPPALCPLCKVGVYNECRRHLRCPDCRKIFFGRVTLPQDRTHKPEVARYDGLIVSADPWGGWGHPTDEGCSLSCPDEWVRPITWDEYDVAVELERTFWARQGDNYGYSENLEYLRSLPTL
jgi:hypothetical protein